MSMNDDRHNINETDYYKLATKFGFEATPYGFNQLFEYVRSNKELLSSLSNNGFELFSEKWFRRLCENHYVKSTELRSILSIIYGRRCHMCHNTEHNGHEIPLDVHHIDGNRRNNCLSNIILLCKNCHAQTKNYKSGNKKDAIELINPELFLKYYDEKQDIEYIINKYFHTNSVSAFRQAYFILEERGNH